MLCLNSDSSSRRFQQGGSFEALISTDEDLDSICQSLGKVLPEVCCVVFVTFEDCPNVLYLHFLSEQELHLEDCYQLIIKVRCI